MNDTVNKALDRLDRLDSFTKKWIKTINTVETYLLTTYGWLYYTYTNFHPKVRRMIYTTNWIERLNKEFRRTFKIQN